MIGATSVSQSPSAEIIDDQILKGIIYLLAQMSIMHNYTNEQSCVTAHFFCEKKMCCLEFFPENFLHLSDWGIFFRKIFYVTVPIQNTPQNTGEGRGFPMGGWYIPPCRKKFKKISPLTCTRQIFFVSLWWGSS